MSASTKKETQCGSGLATQALAEATDGKEADFSRTQFHVSLEEDHSNCLAALASLLMDGNAELALRMGVALWPFWEARGHWTGGREHLSRFQRSGEMESVHQRLLKFHSLQQTLETGVRAERVEFRVDLQGT